MIRLWAVLLLALPLLGQPRRAEVFGAIGAGKVYDDEGSLGSGPSGGGGIGYRLRKRLGVEAEVNGFRSTRDFGGGAPVFRMSGLHVMANALSHFGPPKAQFYVLGAAGVVRVSTRTRADGGLNLGFGVGLKIFATERVYLRPDFRIFAGRGGSAIESPITRFRMSVGVGYSW